MPVLIEGAAQTLVHLAVIWSIRTGISVRVVSGNDHSHARHSLHYVGRAEDFHSPNLDKLAEFIRSFGYKVLFRVPGHYSHIHAEV